MTRKRFFALEIDPESELIELPGQASHHLENVLRSEPGDPVELLDGNGRAWAGVIAEVKAGRVVVRITGEEEPRTESPLDLSLAVAFSRSEKMDLILRQATELGFSRFIAFRSCRSQYGLAGAGADKRKERWLKIAREAICQCGRVRLPEIVLVSGISALLEMVSQWGKDGDVLKLLALEAGAGESLWSLRKSFPSCGKALAVVGPEGGWTPEEADQLIVHGFHAVRLGPRIMRLETAATALVASAQFLWGDLGG